MAFHDRTYLVYLLLTDPMSAPLWSWERWFEVYRALDPIVRTCGDKVSVRVSQSTIANSPEQLRFGRLVWSPNSFEKWAHGSPTTKERSPDWNFHYAEIAVPSLSAASRIGRPPDFFFNLTNEAFLTRASPLAFNQRVFVAVAADIVTGAEGLCEGALRKIAGLAEPRLAAKIVRPWGYSFGTSGGFTRSIQDMPVVGTFKIGQPHTRPVTLDTLEERWALLI